MRHRGETSEEAARIDAEFRQNGKPIEDAELEALVPLIVPRSFSESGVWPGPIHHLAAHGFDQTWAILWSAESRYHYVDRPTRARWEASGVPWMDIALRNLRSIAADELCNHFVPREDGSPLLVVMLYGRGLGPARLLIPDLFDDIFPEGYRVAVPEMTCAVAHTTVTSTSEAQKIAEVIEGLYRVGTEPISPESFDPQLFWDMAPEDAGAR